MLCLALLAAGCGHATHAATPSTATVETTSAPDSLDPSVGYSTGAAEAMWSTHLTLLTYRHANGAAGTQLIPALATSLPRITDGDRTYAFTLRPGLQYTDGQALRASDFTHAIERAIRLDWGGKAFFTGTIAGAQAYDDHKAPGIDGIVTDDARRTITIHLTRPYGAFPDVLAFPSAAPLPGDTPMKALPNDPPPGVGPYAISGVVPNRGFTLTRHPEFAKQRIPGIPVGSIDTIAWKIVSTNLAEGEDVLDDRADVFDSGDTIPPGLLQKIRAQAGNRFAQVAQPETLYFFLNVHEAPFDSLEARQAVEYAIDRGALERLASGFLDPSCFLLPVGIAGHPEAPCPYGDRPDLAKARQLVEQSGTKGTKVTVWGRKTSPFAEFSQYYASVLSSLGYKTTLKLLADSVYYQTIGSAKTRPQTGYAEWQEDFPNPADFYLLLDEASIQPQGNLNLSQARDPVIQRALKSLDPRPATDLQADAAEWSALDVHSAEQGYMAVIGRRSFPKFMSDRIDFAHALFSPVYLDDIASWRLAQP
jgi:peptide/nickel transport system substrate-binding protein